MSILRMVNSITGLELETKEDMNEYFINGRFKEAYTSPSGVARIIHGGIVGADTLKSTKSHSYILEGIPKDERNTFHSLFRNSKTHNQSWTEFNEEYIKSVTGIYRKYKSTVEDRVLTEEGKDIILSIKDIPTEEGTSFTVDTLAALILKYCSHLNVPEYLDFVYFEPIKNWAQEYVTEEEVLPIYGTLGTVEAKNRRSQKGLNREDKVEILEYIIEASKVGSVEMLYMASDYIQDLRKIRGPLNWKLD